MTRTDSKPAVAAVKDLLGGHPDQLRQVVRAVMQEMLEAEMTDAIGAGKGERTPARVSYRSGYYTRTLVTRVGKLELRVPQDRDGRFSTELFERYQRSEQALVATLAEMYVQGVVDGAEALTGQPLSISAATIDRLFTEDRLTATTGRRRRAGMSSAIMRDVPIRTFNDWGSPEPGFVEADFVAHGGTSMAGSFIQTLVLTDVATGWTECVPMITRSAPLIIAAMHVCQTVSNIDPRSASKIDPSAK